MQIHFLNLEHTELPFYEASLKRHRISLSKSPSDVPRDAEIVSPEVGYPIDTGFLDSHPALRLLATRSATVEHIDVVECTKRGITVCHVPHYSSRVIAEHTFALILALARRLREAIEANRTASFSYESVRALQLHGKTLGVIGTGRIGMRVLQLARAFGMKRIAYDIEPRQELPRRLHYRYVSLFELLRRADIVSLHASLTDSSYHMLNRDTLSNCRRGVMIINTAHGALIETEALIEAIDSGLVGGVGLDVLEDERVLRKQSSRIIRDQIVEHLKASSETPGACLQCSGRTEEVRTLVRDEELLSRSNVIFTPHVAFNTPEAMDCINRTTVENIMAYLAGSPVNVVVTGSA
ncbi:NAD(P)-dependent oxidoreductase [Verrucomicrobiota bacterium sgz303538]